jgi:carbon storage regulator CsrA
MLVLTLNDNNCIVFRDLNTGTEVRIIRVREKENQTKIAIDAPNHINIFREPRKESVFNENQKTKKAVVEQLNY